MKLTILNCVGFYPSKRGGNSSYLIEGKGSDESILLDCGSGALAALSKIDKDIPKTIILTHTHHDHMSDILPLAYVPDSNFTVYMPCDNSPTAMAICSSGFNIVNVSSCDSFTLGGLQVEFVPAMHPVPTLGVIITEGDKRFYYTADTQLSDTVKRLVPICDLTLADCVAGGKHMTPEQILPYVPKGGKVIATHLPPLGEVNVPEPLIMAKPFDTYEI